MLAGRALAYFLSHCHYFRITQDRLFTPLLPSRLLAAVSVMRHTPRIIMAHHEAGR